MNAKQLSASKYHFNRLNNNTKLKNMKRKLTFLLTALALLTFLTPAQRANGQTRSQTITFEAAVYQGQGGPAGTGGTATATQDGVTIASTKAYYAGAHIREYTDGTLTVSSDEAITKVVIHYTGTSYMRFTTTIGSLTPNTTAITHTWTGSTNELVFTASAQVRWTYISVTYGGTVPDAVATPTFSPEPGIYIQPQEVTINCETEGATIHYTTNGSNPTASSTTYTGGFTLSTNTTVKAIAVKNGMINSSIASATYNFNIPVTIAVARTYSTGSNVFTAGIVTGISTNEGVSTAYIQDTTGAIVVYGEFDAAIGDEITVQGKKAYFQGLAELTQPVVTIISHDNTVTPAEKSIAEIKANSGGYQMPDSLQARLVRIVDAEITAITTNDGITVTTINQGENSITIYNYNIPGALVGRTFSLTGNVGYHYSPGVQIVNPRDFDFNDGDQPSIIINPNQLTLNYDQHSGTLVPYYANIETITNPTIVFYQSDGETPTTCDWLVTNIDENNNITYFMAVNDASTPRTAYFRERVDLAGENIYSNLVSITQARRIYDYASLPFNWGGGSTYSFNNQTGASTHGVEEYVDDPDNYLWYSPYSMKFNTTGDYILVKTGEKPGIVTINVKKFGGSQTSYFTLQGSADGVNFTDIKTLAIRGVANTTHTLTFMGPFDESHRYVRLVFTCGASVGVGAMSITKGSDPTIILDDTEFLVDATEQSNTLTVQYLNFQYMGDIEVRFYQAGGYYTTTYDWITASINQDNNLTFTVAANDGAVRTAYLKLYVHTSPTYAYYGMYSELIAITQVAEAQSGTYTLVESTEDLVPGSHYIFVGKKTVGNTTNYYAMGGQSITASGNAGNNRSSFEVTPEGNSITILDPYLHQFTLSGPSDDTCWTIHDKNEQGASGSTGFLYSYTSNPNSNILKTRNDANDYNSPWTIEIGEGGAANIQAQNNSTSRNTMRFNATDLIFSCYLENNNQQDVYLYVKNDDPVYEFYSDANVTADIAESDSYTVHSPAVLAGTLTNQGTAANFIIESGAQFKGNSIAATVQKAFNKYTSDRDHYYLLASPMAEALTLSNPNHTNLISNEYDLYKFNQAQDEWVNHKSGTFTTLDNTTGYLYANNANMTAWFVGNLKSSNTDVAIPLTYSDEANLKGWNLVGNPFPCKAYLNSDLNFYKINGTELVPASGSIPPCEGVFVKATAEGQSVSFTATMPRRSEGGILNINLNTSSGLPVDMARIRFSEGTDLEKFMLHDDATCLFIPQNGTDCAVVHTSHTGEIPVCFKASEDGTYSIMVNTENVEMEYLHLIDNMTGADIDLLQTPSYSFEAQTTDSASRFRLAFRTSTSENTEK